MHISVDDCEEDEEVSVLIIPESQVCWRWAL